MFTTLTKSAMTLGATAGCLLMAASSASAFSFTTQFTPDSPDPTADITLLSVTVGDKIIDFSDLAVVSGANILANDQIAAKHDPIDNPKNKGAASADVGDTATTGVELEQLTPGDATSEAAIVTNLSSSNLNNIIDSEDKGVFELELTFDKAFNSLLFWERGLNSILGVKIGEETHELNSANFDYAGYNINTTEIGNAQPVGSYGLRLDKLGISGDYTGPVTLYANKSFNGPDFKVAGASVPEPATVLGLTAIAGAFVASRRRKSSEVA